MVNVQQVSDFSAFAPEKIEHFAKLLNRSAHRRRIFQEIYRGKSKNGKTAAEIGKRVGLTAKRVLEIAGPLAASHLFEQTKREKLTAYKKYPAVNTVRTTILRLAKDEKKLAAHVTVRKPKTSLGKFEVRIGKDLRDVSIEVRFLTIDGIDNFSKVRSLRHNGVPDKFDPKRLPEKLFKTGIANILGNKGTFKDWGGEKNDLYTTHLKVKGARYPAAIGLKGPATTGTLTPGKMGHNGDQIQRLFDSDAQVFLVQYEGPIAESVSQQLKGLAVNKSVEDQRPVFYGTIALEDSYRLRLRYPKEFGKAGNKAK
jgi:hypothetical protein